PHQKYGPSCTLASSNRRLVYGDVQLNCVNMLGWFSLVAVASGDVIIPPKPSPVPSPPSSQYRQWYWTLVHALNLLRGDTCHVSRPEPLFQLPSAIACSVRTGSYVQALGLPAFLLTHMLATFCRLIW